jgi:hypothetical protein
VQSVAFAVFHASPVELVTASIAVAVALVVAHEALVLPVLRPQAKARRRPAQ